MENNALIFGKDDTSRVVSLEIEDNNATLFIQNEDGSISTEQRKNSFWILAHNKLNDKFKPLEGNLFYRYIISTPHRELFTQARRDWKNKDIFSVYNNKEAFMIRSGVTYFKGLKYNEVSILSFDIETTGLVHDETSKILLITNTFRDSKGNIQRKTFAYDNFATQGKMLDTWCSWVRAINPSIICGHNIFGFDFPYMQYIAEKQETILALGRDCSNITFNKYTSAYRIDGSRTLDYKSIQIFGREILDTMFLSYKSGVFESYGLKSLIKELGLENKDRTFYDASKIRENYLIPEEWVKIKTYAEEDADDALKLWDKFGSAYFYATQSIPKAFQTVIESASGAQINSMMIRGYLQDGHSIPKASPVGSFQGGISFGIPGIYRNCWKLDIKSCYPSAILINKLYSHEKDPKAYMYELCKHFTLQRFEYKKLAKTENGNHYKALDAAAKIFINSIFGFCSAPGLLFNDPKVAAKITEYGRKFLSDGMVWATGKDSKYWIVKAGGEVEVEQFSDSQW